MKIGTIFTAAALSIGAVAVAGGSYLVATSWSRLADATTAASLAAAYSDIVIIPERITQERAVLSRVLAVPEVGAAQRTMFEESRRATDQTFEAALASASRLSGPIASETQRFLNTVRGEMQTLRGQMEQAMQAPQHAERLRQQPILSSVSLRIQGTLNPAIDRIELGLAAASPALGEIAGVARQVLDLREAASATIVPVGGAVRQARPATVEELTRMERGLGAFDALRARLGFMTLRSGETGAIRRAYVEADRETLEAPRAKVVTLATESRAGRAPSLTLAEWDRGVIDALFGMFRIRDVALRELQEEGGRQVASARFWLTVQLGTIVLVLVGLAGGALMFRRKVLAALERIAGLMGAVAAGNYAVAIPDTGRRDEVGQIASALAVFKDNALRMRELDEQQKAEQAAKAERQKVIEGYIAAFDRSASVALEKTSESVRQAAATADSLAGTAETTSRQAGAVAAASEQASANVQTVAAAAEELNASIAEIGRQVQTASTMAGGAVEQAEQTNRQVQGLAEAAQKIGDVVKLISDIAAQTNLLALNATIEAARAGDAGKGFAVVASEVKNLATQTAKATEDISQQIASIQGATGEAVTAIQGIGKAIVDINQVASSIAAAVEEQNASTREIARNVQEASAGTQEVSSNITGVTQAAGETGTSARRMLEAAKDLSQQSETLRGEVARFLGQIRAA